MIHPLWWLAALLGVIVMLRLISNRRQHRTAMRLSAVAREARMNFSAIDRFQLATRLQQSPCWTGGVLVYNVIYGTAGGERRFVATVDRRATRDDRPQRSVVACVESLDEGDFRECGEPIRVGKGKPSAEIYRDALVMLGSRTAADRSPVVPC